MKNVFRKLLCREFGGEMYDQLFQGYQRKIQEHREVQRMTAPPLEKEGAYLEIYEMLQGKERRVLEKMDRRLKNAMQGAAQVHQNFLWTILFYLIGMVLLTGLGLHPLAVIPATVLLTIGFAWKIYEFIIHRCNYVDACIIMLYRVALDRVLREKKGLAQ